MALSPDRRAPAAVRLSDPLYESILDVHERAMKAGMARYPDPATGLWVFTAEYLWNRGKCCDTGCRHCPYLDR